MTPGFLGAGNDLFVWNHGDDNDTIEGQSGTDTLRFNGCSASARIIQMPPPMAGGRCFSSDVASVLMDLNDVERIEFQALGGS